MAIIRKGDKAAEAALKAKADKQPNKPIRWTEKDPKQINVSLNKKTGKSEATTTRYANDEAKTVKYERPVKGKDVAKRAKAEGGGINAAKSKLGSGIIQSGKVVKGGNISLNDSLRKKKEK